MDTQTTNTKLKFKKWPELRSKYIYEWASLLDLSKEYDGQISYNAIADRCKVEGWVKHRQEHWAQVGQDLGEIVSAKTIEAKKTMLESANLLLQVGKKALEKHLEELDSKGEKLSLRDAMSAYNLGFKAFAHLIDKADNDNQYNHSRALQEDRDVANDWMRAYFDLLHAKGLDKENNRVSNTSNNMRSQALG